MASGDDWQATELAKCAADFAYFCDTYGVIDDAQGASGDVGGTTRFRLWPAQVGVCWRLMLERLVIILKARQLGISWIVCMYALWLCLFKPNQLVLLFSQGETEAVELLRRIRVLYERLPDWMRERLPSQVDEFPLDVEEDNSTLFGFSNSSRCQSLPATKKAGRGNAASLAIVDEAAFLPWPMELYTALKPAIDGGGRLIMLSTANGIGGLFHWLWIQAASKANRFAAIFLPWWSRPGRDAAWYARMRAEHPDPAKIKQEYPATANEAFISSGRVRFDQEWIDRQARNITVTPVDPKDYPKGTPQVPGFKLWVPPKPDARLLLPADVAEGLEHGDYSTAPLFDIDTWEVYGELHGHWEPDYFGQLLHDLSEFYQAQVMVERNNHGGTTLAKLKSLRNRRVCLGHDDKPGWLTNAKTKPLAVDALAEALRDGLLKERSHAALDELQLYRVDKDGGTNAPDGYHDDRVMARAIALGSIKLALVGKRKIQVS